MLRARAAGTEGDPCASVFIPGTFDPITLGHIDIIQRAMALVDRLVIGVAINRDKGPLFTLEERVAMVEAECAAIIAKTGGEIVVHPFENLLIDCARDVGASDHHPRPAGGGGFRV